MQLVSLSLRNWRNIARLTLSDLDHPLVVLTGPNRVGKSSLYAAIRAALFEDPASSSKEVRAHTPWLESGIPEVLLEFRHAGEHYRVEKKFSKGKEGGARLERRANAGWTRVADGKQVLVELPRLLGIGKVDDSLIDLLWVDQGLTSLPTKLGAGLRQQFETVLGSLLTDRDHRVLEAARTRVEDWFTSRGEPKVKTELATLRSSLEEVEARCAELERRRTQSEAARRRYRDVEAGIAELHRGLALDARELNALKVKRRATQEKRLLHEQTQTALAAARAREDAARDRLARRTAEAQRRDDIEARLRTSDDELATLQTTCQQQAAAIETRRAVALTLSSEVATRRHELVTARDRLQRESLSRQRDELVARLEARREIQDDLERLRTERDALVAPTDAELKQLNGLRQELTTLSARLAATSARFSFRATTAIRPELTVDSDPIQSRNLAPGDEWTAAVGTSAELILPGVGSVRFEQVDPLVQADLKRRQSELTDSLRTLLAPFGVAADALDLWDLLALRRERFLGLSAQIDSLTKSLAPKKKTGGTDEAADLARLNADLAALSIPSQPADSTDPAQADPSESASDAVHSAEGRLLDAEQRLEAAREAITSAQQLAESAQSSLQRLELSLATDRATLTARTEELERLGDLAAIEAELTAAGEEVQESQLRELATRLAPEEERLDDDIRDLEVAITRQSERLRRDEAEIARLFGEFRADLGLHDELTAEDARKEQLKARLEACELEGRGRKRLFELLESTRQTQIGEVTRVLSDRTLAWAKHLGLDELRGLEFDTGYLPSGLHRRDLSSVQPLSSESFGTHEQLALLVRLAAGMALARDERQLAVLDDPLTHADVVKHQRMLDIFCQITRPTAADSSGAGGLQLLVLSCHPERFRRLPAHVPVVDLVAELDRSRTEA